MLEHLGQRLDGRKEVTRHPLIDRLHLLTFIFGIERLKLRGDHQTHRLGGSMELLGDPIRLHAEKQGT
jgi:hypothetical protein